MIESCGQEIHHLLFVCEVTNIVLAARAYFLKVLFRGKYNNMVLMCNGVPTKKSRVMTILETCFFVIFFCYSIKRATIISTRKDTKDNKIPRPSIKKAGDKSSKVKGPILVSGGTSVRHLLVALKYAFLYRITMPLSHKR